MQVRFRACSASWFVSCSVWACGPTIGYEDPIPASTSSTSSEDVESDSSASAGSSGSQPEPRCGDGHRDPGELCDDGDDGLGDDCSPTCQWDADIVRLASGGLHTCALQFDGSLRCWGLNYEGQLGYGHVEPVGDDETPMMAGDVAVADPVIDVAVSRAFIGVYGDGMEGFTCAVDTFGAVQCWGMLWWFDPDGTCQTSCTTASDCCIGDDETPLAAASIPLSAGAISLSLGFAHACAVLDDGSLQCWGSNIYGQLGVPGLESFGRILPPAETQPVQVGAAVTQVAAGLQHTCALTDAGSVLCWGYGASGVLGYGNTETIGDDETPLEAGAVELGGAAVQITAGTNHTCALLDTGAIRCWGAGAALGYGSDVVVGDNETPAAAGDVDVGGSAIQVAAGDRHTCAVLDSGAVRCWGSDEGTGRLGYGNTSTCGATENCQTAAQCCIGDDETPASVSPVDVGGPVDQIIVGSQHTCALLSDDTVRCWGAGTDGLLGYGNTYNIGDDEPPSSAGAVPVR